MRANLAFPSGATVAASSAGAPRFYSLALSPSPSIIFSVKIHPLKRTAPLAQADFPVSPRVRRAEGRKTRRAPRFSAHSRDADRVALKLLFVGDFRCPEGREVALVHDGRPCIHPARQRDRKSTRLNSSHGYISYAVFCLK